MRKKSVWLAVALGALALAGCSSNKQPAAETPNVPDVSITPLPAQDLKNTVCPVSGDKIGDSTNVVVYDGKVYHVCCPDCHKDFVKDPQKYATEVSADPAKYGVSAPKSSMD